MYHRFFDVRGLAAQSLGADVAINSTACVEKFEIDSKAMRKWHDEQVLFGMLEVAEFGTASMEVIGITRLLVKFS